MTRPLSLRCENLSTGALVAHKLVATAFEDGRSARNTHDSVPVQTPIESLWRGGGFCYVGTTEAIFGINPIY